MNTDQASSSRGMPTENLGDDFAVIPVASHEGSALADSTRREILPGYHLLERIGAGGYGTVWRAEAPGGLAKAIKIVHGQVDEKRAADEWKALRHVKGVRHPFLLSLERIEVVEQQLVVVTELADGSLKDRFDMYHSSGRPGIPRDELMGYLAETADALDYMSSEHGLQHLDVKPENLLLVGNHVKVADFGLVKNVHGSSISMIAGLTPMFSAPETFDGRPTDRSDQYSLAVVYQYLLTGKCPFQGQTFAQLASQHLHARPDLSPLPESDRAVIERALAKDPFDRFPSCRSLVERLRGGSVVAPRPSRAPQTRPPESSHPAEPRKEFQTEVIDAATPMGKSADTEKISDRPSGTVVELPPLQLSAEIELQPTLFIGIGSCGIKALRGLEQRLSARFGSLDSIPSVRMLAVDTDDEPQPKSDDKGNPNHSFLHVPLRSTQYYRRQAEELTRWLNRRWIYNIPKTLLTEGIRPLGRLALVDHIARVEQNLRAELAEICHPNSLATSGATVGTPVNPQKVRVVIVGSISSGTGGGMVWDMVQIVHQALPHGAGNSHEITCVLAHWSTTSPKEMELSTANSCAALLELNHYMTEGCPGDPAIHLPALGRHHNLFENVYVLNLGAHDNPASFDAAALQLSEYLDANVLSTTANFISGCRVNGNTPRSKPGLRMFALNKISDADLASLEQLARQLIDPSAPPERRLANARRKAIENFLAERIAAMEKRLFVGGGARRFFVATSEELQKAGFAALVQQHLPSQATTAIQSEEGILLLCECQGISPTDVAWSIAENRPDLFSLAGRLVTRCDVAWSPL